MNGRILCSMVLIAGLARVSASEIRKAPNGDPLDSGLSWFDGIAPTSTDVAVWDLDSAGFSGGTPFGNLDWQGIRLLELQPAFGGTLSFPGGSYTLSLGAAGIDMSAADCDLDINNDFTSLTANQVWAVGRGRTLSLWQQNGIGTGALNKEGPGLLRLVYNSSISHINDAAVLGLGGGAVSMEGGSYFETVGSTSVYGDHTRVVRSFGSPVLALNNISRSVGGTVEFAQDSIAWTTSGNDGSEQGGILGGWATVAGGYWAQVAPGGGYRPISNYMFLAVSDYYETNNVNLQFATLPFASSRAINSLRFENDAALSIGAFSLTNLSGGILMGGPSSQGGIIGSGTMYPSAGQDLIFHTPFPHQLLTNLVRLPDHAFSGLTKTGPGTLLLNQGANNTYAGPTTINGGTLQTGNVSNRRYVSSALRINHDGTYLHGTGDSNLTLTAVNVNGGVLNLAGRADYCPSLILAYNGTIVGFSPVRTFTVGNASTPLDARWGQIDVRLHASGGLVKTTDRKVIIARTNTLVGTTRIENGALQIMGNSIVGAGSLIIGTTTNNAKLILGGTNVVGTDFSGAMIITNLAVLNPGPLVGNAIVGGSTHADNKLILNFGYDTNFDLTLLGGPGPYENSVGLTKTGAGTLSLTNGGSFTGPIRVEAGTVKLTSAFNIQNQPVEVAGGLLDLNGVSPTLSSLSGVGSVSNGGFSAATLFLKSGNYSGVIADGGNSVAVWATLWSVGLYGNNTYSGGTVITNGAVVSVSDISTIGSGQLTLAGGNFNITANRTAPLPNAIDLKADAYIENTGIQNLVAAEFSGSVGGGAGTLRFINSGLNVTNLFEPCLSGSFDFNRPIVITDHALILGLNGKTRLVSGNTNGTTQTYSGAISGNGSFRRSVNGELGGVTIFSASNSYSGPTLVDNGTLLVNGSISTNVVTVTNLGTLGGNGTIRGPVLVQNGGTLSAGTSIGRLVISNALTFAGGSTNFVELNKTTGTNDLVRGLTSVTYGGTLVVEVLSGTLAANDSFKIFDATTYSGAFTNIVPATPGAGLMWNTSGLVTNGTLKVVVVPPPQFTSAVVSGANLIAGGSGGNAGGSYHVLSSTNVALPVINWTPVATNVFDGAGNFFFTNGIVPGVPRQFFLIRLP